MKYLINLTVGDNSASLTTYCEKEEDVFISAKNLYGQMKTTSDRFSCVINNAQEVGYTKKKEY